MMVVIFDAFRNGAIPPRRDLLSRTDRRIYRTLAHHSLSGPRMEFTILFLAIVIVMLVAWRGSRLLALGLFAAVMIGCVATYLHHATDKLQLSF
jgi:Family of unknown function (DUF5993)